MKNDDVDNLLNELSKLPLEWSDLITKLAEVEKKIAKSFDRKDVAVKATVVTKEQQPTAVDRVENYIFEGDSVRVLSQGMYKGETTTVIQIVDNKKRKDSRSRPSWRLPHNLLKLNTEN